MTDDLTAQAEAFASDLTTTVQCVSPACSPFVATTDGRGRLVVQQSPTEGVPLFVDGEPLLSLTVQYFCTWDSHERFLAVERSEIHVYDGDRARREPIFRYEYDRTVTAKDRPGAHLHIHAHRDKISYVMGRAGSATRRAGDRVAADKPQRVSALHIPVGGPRFRPCLEDILEMLVCEFGVESTDGAREVLREGRRRWRVYQLGSAVRDHPAAAADVLEELGYTVKPPGAGHPAMNEARLDEL